jgi:uncharacterized membrane protein (DUF485 family)
MSEVGTDLARTEVKRRIRNGALALAGLALAFYVGFIVLLVYRSHHG